MPSQLESMLLEHGSGTMRVETSHPNAKLPEQRATGGYDLWPTERLDIPANGRATVGTGVCIQYVSGVVGLVIAKKNQMWGVDVVTSVLDAESRGEIRVVVHNGTDKTVSIDPGKAIAQILFSPIAMPGIHTGRNIGSATVGTDDGVRHGSSHRHSGGSTLTAGIGAGSTQHCDPKRGDIRR